MRVVAAPDQPVRRGLDQRARHRRGVGEIRRRRHAIGAGELHPGAPVAVAQQVDELAEARLRRPGLGAEHAHVGEAERTTHFRKDRKQLLGQPAGRQEIEMPAELGAARVEPLDARAAWFLRSPARAASPARH
jgi:hypothetical protein